MKDYVETGYNIFGDLDLPNREERLANWIVYLNFL